MEIVKGKVPTPIRAVAYGPEGIGKSTFASRWPKPLFVDAEGGTVRLDVDRIHPLSWEACGQAVDELAKDAKGYQTLVLDTADWFEKMLVEAILAEANKKSIEDFGYGKGYTRIAEGWKRFLDRLAAMQRANGMHVLFLAHAAMRKFEQPDEAGAYDRWELKLLKQSPGVLKEWADLVLFLNYKTIVVEADGKHKVQGGKRVIYTTHHACWDAKNRFGLPEEMPLDEAALPAPMAAIFAGLGTPAATPVASKPAEKPATKPAAKATDMPGSPEKAKLLAQLAQLMHGDGITKEDLGAELARKGIVPADMNPRDYNEQTLGRIVAGWSAVVHNINARRQAAA
jgi:GTPase SAR1 family protein